MTDAAATERRRQKIQERIAAEHRPESLDAEEPTWIPTPRAVGGGHSNLSLLRRTDWRR
jgi:hypothetical protein